MSCLEVLAVYFAWVRYDLVTAHFARPWMWREPSMAPLYATGSEFSWRETAWAQGMHECTHARMHACMHAGMKDEFSWRETAWAQGMNAWRETAYVLAKACMQGA